MTDRERAYVAARTGACLPHDEVACPACSEPRDAPGTPAPVLHKGRVVLVASLAAYDALRRV